MENITVKDKEQFEQLISNLIDACSEYEGQMLPNELMLLTLDTITTYAIVFKYNFDDINLFDKIFTLLNKLILATNLPYDFTTSIINVVEKMNKAKTVLSRASYFREGKEYGNLPIMSSVFALSGILEEEDVTDGYKYI